MKRGFTLIELIIAIFILTVGISAILVMFPLGIQIVKSSEMATVATQLAQEKIEEIISKSYTDISSETKQQLSSPFSAYWREVEMTYFDPDNPEVTPSVNKGIKKVEVTVSWELPLKVVGKSIKIMTLISKR